MEDHEKKFIEGFNNGYLISKHQPGLFKELEQGLKTQNDYTKGFIAGGKEVDKEKSINITKGNKYLDKDIDKDR